MPSFAQLKYMASAPDIDNATFTASNLVLGRRYAQQNQLRDAFACWSKASIMGSEEATGEIIRNSKLIFYGSDDVRDKIDAFLNARYALRHLIPLNTEPHPQAALFLGQLSEELGLHLQTVTAISDENRISTMHAALNLAGAYYKAAAEVTKSPDTQSSALAANALACLYLEKVIGSVIPSNKETSNEEKAFHYTQKTAEAGLGEAWFNLAVLHYRGIGTQKDITAAYRCLEKAVEQIPDPHPWRQSFRAEAMLELAWLEAEMTQTLPHRTGDRLNPRHMAFPKAYP